jgi:hypothetical protein
MISLGNEQQIKNLNELWLDPNGNYHKFEQKQRARRIRHCADRFPLEEAQEGRYALCQVDRNDQS